MSRFRRTGADRPWGDPRGWHGVPMEGYYWRFTDAAAGRAVVVYSAVCRARDGVWGMAGLAAHPGGFERSAIVERATADPARLAVRMGDALVADERRLRVTLGDDARLDVELTAATPWPRRAFGALGPAHAVPALPQYWHPHLLAGAADGEAVLGGERIALSGARAYAEKNWGRSFPGRWWWGHAHDFGDAPVGVSFAGGPVAGVELTAAVVRIGEIVLATRPPGRVQTRPGEWRLRARAGLHRVEVEGRADPPQAHVLQVPVVAERRATPSSHQQLAGTLALRVTRRGRTVFEGESPLAGLEVEAPPR